MSVESSDREDTASGLLAALVESNAAACRAEVEKFRQAALWADLHPVESICDAATVPGTQGELTIAGDGAPLVAEWCVPELAAALGMSTDAGRIYLGDAVETRHRLPRTWALVMAGRVPVWKARRVAQQTLTLSAEAATFVDGQLAPGLRGCSFAQVERTVEAARSRFDPADAEARRVAAAERRRLDVDLGHVGSTDGTVGVFGMLDVADAVDLDAALATGAAQLAAAGCGASLNVRRARAAGALARGEVALDLRLPTGDEPADAAVPGADEQAEDDGIVAEPVDVAGAEVASRPTGRRPRQVVLHVHLHAHAVAGSDGGDHPGDTGGAGELVLDPVADLANTRSPVLLEQIKDWCQAPGAKVTIRPVLDLGEHLEVPGYTPSPLLRRQVELTHPECVFPHCHRPSAGCDLDHVIPHARGGPTCSCNLVPLCRRHHRLKTHAGWRLHRTGPRLFVWTSPIGRTYTVHRGQTDDLTGHPDTEAKPQPGSVAPPDRHPR